MDAEPRTPSVLTRGQLGWAWGGTAVVILVFGVGVTDWQTIVYELLGGNTAEIVAFTAGYTLPLTIGIGLSFGLLLALFRSEQQVNPLGVIALICGILIGAGLASSYFGLGLAPQFDWALGGGGPWYIRMPTMVLAGYFSTYGWALMVCSLAIGVTAVLHVDYWRHKPSGIVEDLGKLAG